MKTKIIVILGPTASGKSDLAVKLAKKFGGEVISADSRQVYKGLNIGTGKITKKEMRGVAHHLLDVADPRKQFSVVDYQVLTMATIGGIVNRGKLPIICGGTGFYIDAVVDGTVLPNVPPNPKLREKLKNKSAEQLFKILKKLDPERTKTIDRQNPRRLIRAIEIVEALGRVPKLQIENNKFQTLKIGIKIPYEELRDRINRRLDKRIKQGLLKEVKELHKNGLSWKRMYELGLEYKYIAQYYTTSKMSKMPFDRSPMKKVLQEKIWQYAKRQMTWFKKSKDVIWMEPNIKKIEKEVRKFLSK